MGLIHSEPRSWVPGTKAQLLATLLPCCANVGLGAPREASWWLGKRAPQEAGAAATRSLPCVSLPLCPSLKASSCDQSPRCHLPALPSPCPCRARPRIPTGLLASKGVGLGLERARGPGRPAAFGRAPGSHVPGSKPVASPRKACAPRAWPRRDSWVAGTASCSMRGLHTGPGGDTRRLARPVSPRAALAARTPGNGLRTKPPAPRPHPESTHKAPSGPRCTAPRPRPTLGDTGPRVPAPAPGQPPTLQNTLMQLLHGHQRPHAGATQSQAARPRVRAPLALGPRPDPCPLSPHATRRPRPGPCPRTGRPAHLGARGHSGARRPALRLRGPEARAPMGVRRGGRPGGKEGGPRRPLLGPRQGSQLPWRPPPPPPPPPGSASGLSEPRRERGRHRGAGSRRRA